MFLTNQQYYIFRDRVLAKTTGENVHKVNGLLGQVINASDSGLFWTARPGDKSAEYIAQAKGIVDNALTEIAKLTGVHP